jgi:hypothetical protein
MLLKKTCFSIFFFALMLGLVARITDAKVYGRQLHPICKKYLDRRAAWYKYIGNKAELKENYNARKAFSRLPYKEQYIRCHAAYEAFDDFDRGKFRR